MSKAKTILPILMLLSYLPVILFQYYPDQISLHFVGRFLGLTGVVTLMWQYLLGARGLVTKIIPDLLWLNNVHKLLGKYGISLIFFHPGIMFTAYLGEGINLIVGGYGLEFDIPVKLGGIAFTTLVSVWLISVFAKTRVGFRKWKKIHILNYIILPLVIIHSLYLGFNLDISPVLRNYWYFIALVYSAILVYRILHRFGINQAMYKVNSVNQIANETVEVQLFPVKATSRKYAAGQFIYIRPGLRSESHPFSIVSHDPETNSLTIAIKNLGSFTAGMQAIKPGTEVWVDGPFGIFAEELAQLHKPVILIAGGIGITPMVSYLQSFTDQTPQTYLFYGNKTSTDIAYDSLIKSLAGKSNFKAVNVLSDEPGFTGEKGRISLDLIKKYVPENLESFDFFLSGPPPMVKGINAELSASSVNKSQVHTELFTL